MTDDDRVKARLQSLAERTARLGASPPLAARLLRVPDVERAGSLASAIARLAIPSLAFASLAAAALFAVDAARDRAFDEDLAIAATMDVGP
jgi:hypothetical protein